GAVTLSPDRDVVNLATGTCAVPVRLDPLEARFDLPPGWRRGETLNLPEQVKPGPYELPVTLDRKPALTVTRIHAPHTVPRVLACPALLQVAVIDAALPPCRVAYIGAGRDRVGHWMSRMGLDVVEVDDSTLDDANAMAGFDSIVIGIFALRFRPGLAARMPALHAWTRAGGTLLTLYHRPWDDWDPDTTPPARLEIGQPSLRWRVTDPAAEVTHLAPDHPILTGPNRIGPEDWAGWDKERGLYFAQAWDPAYTPLLAMADPGEDPLHGALLSAEIGAGRHTHCALILHHQMENLVPGAFRLMANLVARR
ncbi:MAG: PIG-L family deacetylase, partial [Jannaschia sp.]